MRKENCCSTRTGYVLTPGQKVYRFIKAFVDFWIGLIVLLALSPVFLIVAIAVKVDSKGPVFFRQKRVGYRGEEFICVKFRSMSVDARPDVAGYEYAGVDSYITKVGAFIRKYSLDELPQFQHLLTGKMSLIGYRPAQANEIVLNTARESYNMYQTRPGLSGWAQVNGRDVLGAMPEKKAQYDNYYLQNLSPWLDLKIVFMTLAKVFKGDDVAEGTQKSAGEETAQPEAVAAK